MINQINQDLQIASPSKVMAKIGMQVGAGLARGVEMSKGIVQGAIAKMPVLGSGAGMVNSQNRTSSMIVNMYGVGNRRTVGDIMALKARAGGI